MGAAFFSYLNGVWEWVQVTSDHVNNHYTCYAHSYTVEKASNPILTYVSSIAPPTECSLAVTMPSAGLSHKGGATSSLQKMKVYPGSSDPSSGWTTWEEHLALKLGEFTPDQIISVITQNQLKVERAVASIFELFDTPLPDV